MPFRKLTFVFVMIAAAMLVACGVPEPEIVAVQESVPDTAAPGASVIEEAPEEEAPEVSIEVDEESGAVMLPSVDPLSCSGDIAAAGSSTVFPLAERLAADFEAEGYSDLITIDSIGSGGGFERFCVTGESDVANASRAIKESEVAGCEAIGRTPIEFRVGTDALAVVVSAENDFLESVTSEEVAMIFSTAINWSDVNSAWPDQKILRYIPGTDSGTFDYFVEEVFDEDEAPILAADNTTLSEDDNVLVQGITGSPYAVGFFGYAYYQENASALTILEIDGVPATKEMVDAAEYPLARPLYMYTTADIITEKPQVGCFMQYMLNNVDDVIEEVGYFPAALDMMNNAKSQLLGALVGDMNATPAMDDETKSDGTLPPVDPLAVTGDVAVAGSSTVFPLAERLAADFEAEGYSDLITIDSIGSGGGFERFCVTGESDVANASRPIKDAEVESCEAIGRTPLEFRVGTDALAVVVSAENDFLVGATMEEVAAIFSTATNWSDVNAAWPDVEILRYVPGTDSGTFDYFVEEVFDEDEAPILAADNTTLSEDDNVLVQGITGSPYAVGFFGYAYYQENAAALTILEIDGIPATKERVDAAEYPLARPLYMYSTPSIMADKPQVAAYLNYVLTNVNDVIEEVGYFAASEADLNDAIQAWQDAQ